MVDVWTDSFLPFRAADPLSFETINEKLKLPSNLSYLSIEKAELQGPYVGLGVLSVLPFIDCM